MPLAPQKPCAHPNCPKLTRARYCEQHAQSQPATPRTVARKIRSSRRWTNASKRKRQEHPLCLDPFGVHSATGVHPLSAETHHIRPVHKHPDEAFDDDNAMPMCVECHDAMEGRHARPARCVVVNGPPASGKTTYVKGQRRPSDLVFDWDEICAALTLSRVHRASRSAFDLASAIRRTVIDWARRTPQASLWFITGERDEAKVQALADELRATVITMSADHGECLLRLESTDRPEWRKVLQREEITAWHRARKSSNSVQRKQ